MNTETDFEVLGRRLGAAITAQVDATSTAVAPIESIERGARRRRARRRGAAGATCVALAGLVAIPITLQARHDNPDVGAAPSRAAALPAYAMLDESFIGRPTSFYAAAAGGSSKADVIDVTLWSDGEGATIAVRDVTPAAVVAATQPPSDLPEPTEAMAPTTAAAVETTSASADDGAGSPTVVELHGMNARITNLAPDQWLVELGANDQRHLQIIARGVDRARLVADVEAMEGSPLAPISPYTLAGRSAGPRWAEPYAPSASVGYSQPSDTNTTYLFTSDPQLPDGVGIDGAASWEVAALVDVAGRPTLVTTNSGATIASWIDAETGLIVTVILHGTTDPTDGRLAETVAHIRMVDPATYQNAARQRSDELTRLPIIADGTVDGAHVTARIDGTSGALCIADAAATETCAYIPVFDGELNSVAANAIVDGHWVIFGYFRVGDLGNGSSGALAEQVGLAKFDTSAGPGEAHYAPAGQGEVFVVRLPDAATSVSTDYGMYYGGMTGEAVRPEVASGLG